MVLFVGIFAGYFVFMHFSDNMGRRFGMLLTWSTVVVGLLLITFSHDMISVSVGLLLAGAGCESNMRIDLSVLN
jgi:MFS family permease